jgi:hypothetical protein
MAVTMDDHGGRRGNGWRIAGWGMAGVILLVPLVAMQFTGEVAWSPSDFIVMAVMLGGIGLTLELAFRNSRNTAYRMAVGVALAASFLLIWITGAVGIIGSERDDANLLFGGVLLVALIGAVAARFRPAGMARAMGAAALVQLLVPAIAWVVTPEARAAIVSPEVPISTVVFVALWLLAARLFRKAAV